MPAAASDVRRPGDTEFRAFKLDVLRIDGGRIAEITTFGDQQFPGIRLAAGAWHRTNSKAVERTQTSHSPAHPLK